MADYYPLLAKAIAGLESNTQETRSAIYDRARSALLRQLAGIDPPVAQGIVDRELGALEAVFLRLDHEYGQPSETANVDPVVSAPTAIPPIIASQEVTAQKTRPRIKPVRKSEETNRKPLLAVGLAVSAVAVFILATLAFLRRDEPPATATRGGPPVQQEAASTPSSSQKPSDRVGVAPPVTPPTGGAPPQASAPPIVSVPAPAQQPPAIAVANRAVLLLQNADKDQPVIERQGSVVWRVEIVSTTQGQTSDRAIKANIDVPEAKLQVEITIQRNRDTAFPASHTIQIKTIPAAGSEVSSIQGITTFEFRQSQDQPGYAVAGQGIAVVDNLFLIALSAIEPTRSRNEEMMKSRPLIYFEFPVTTERRGAILIDKGIGGQQAFDAAFASWQ